MKKLIALILAGLMALSLLASCAPAEEPTEEEGGQPTEEGVEEEGGDVEEVPMEEPEPVEEEGGEVEG